MIALTGVLQYVVIGIRRDDDRLTRRGFTKGMRCSCAPTVLQRGIPFDFLQLYAMKMARGTAFPPTQ